VTGAIVRPVAPEDRGDWEACFRGYREFYRLEHRDEVIDTVWTWLMDPAHPTRGLAAEVGGRVVGIAHFRRFSRPIVGAEGLFLDDLFTLPQARGHGVGTALLRRLAETARDEGASLVRWITAADNATARALYDRVATQTPWVTYDLAAAE